MNSGRTLFSPVQKGVTMGCGTDDDKKVSNDYQLFWNFLNV
jgi:hypothetical protein